MSPGPTFDRVYAALKEQLLSGRWPPGAHLEPGLIGEDLNASITPVRDALHRLVGERLVEAPRHDGFWVPAPTETELGRLYAWQGDLVSWALRCQRLALPEQSGFLPGDAEPGRVMLELARTTDNPELELAIASSLDRLAEYRSAEDEVFPDASEEMSRIGESFRRHDLRLIRQNLRSYHRRRHRAASSILSARRRALEPHGRS